MKAIGIIPSRYDSTRFPGKPLAVIHGKTMINRVYDQASGCEGLSRVIIATDNEVIFKHAGSFGGEVMMTSASHRTGTERCAEIVQKLAAGNALEDVACIVNIQGDEPFIDPMQIRQVIDCFGDPSVSIATLVKKITTQADLESPDVVKVAVARNGDALYFSRSPIPCLRGKEKSDWLHNGTWFRHIGLYAYRPGTLLKLVTLAESPLEKCESLEQLRWLENGFAIRTKETDYESISIDRPEDLLKIPNKGKGN